MVAESADPTDASSESTEDDPSTSPDITTTDHSYTSFTASTETTTSSNGSVTTVHHSSDPGMDTGGSVGVAIVVALLFVGGVLLFLYLRRTGRLKCLARRGRPRRSSTSSSRRALDPDDTESVDNMPRITDSDMFAIAEPEDHDQEQETAGDDGYYYDEVFGSSGFEDETTKASNKELFSVSSDQEVPDLLLRVEDLLNEK